MSLLGIVQHFTSDAKIYGFRTLTAGGDPFGPFVNRNHFAGFVELTLPAGLALLIFRGLRRDMIPLTGLLTIVPVGAMILSGSRGGIVSFGFEVAVLALLARLRKAPEGPRLVALAIVGIRRVGLGCMAGRWESASNDFQLCIRATSRFRAAPPWFAARRIFFSIIRSTALDSARWSLCTRAMKLFTTATSWTMCTTTYMELLAEMGILGGLCGLAFLWILFREARKSFTAEQGHFSRAHPCRSDRRGVWALAPQPGRFQPAHPFERIAVSAASLPRHIGASAFGVPDEAPAHTLKRARAVRSIAAVQPLRRPVIGMSNRASVRCKNVPFWLSYRVKVRRLS